MVTVNDLAGNTITSEEQLPFGSLKIILHIKRQRPRILGYINQEQRIFYAGEKQITVIARGTKYFRFCKSLIEGATLFDRICVNRKGSFKGKYCFSREWLLNESILFGSVDNTFSDNIFIDVKLVKKVCNGR